ncbi:matrixin family metalloprotease [Arthrobacter sp. ZGTC412]|uniref:matrixin family metalloprotease n=1 Tax=Arthrobacter sp. ZGTC412 TaxID=2058900 RepID=UPI0011B03786|nr:matrixin family metalloprotease [Arthrobacter sp. ZGTC412]
MAEAPSATAPVSEVAVPTTAARTTPNGRSKTTPTPGRESQPTPLGSPAPVSTRSDSYAFLGLPDLKQGTVAYDPCRPIHYVTRAANSPEGGHEMINEGFNELSRVTGLQFINDGETLEAPSEQRPMYQPDSYGDRWAPILVAWSNSDESPRLSREQSGNRFTEALGYAGSRAVSPSTKDRYVYVTGQVVLNTPALAEASAVEGPTLTPSVIAHELAHLVGLDHVDDPTQLMYPESSHQRPTYADGDLTGLAALGRGTCSPGL